MSLEPPRTSDKQFNSGWREWLSRVHAFTVRLASSIGASMVGFIQSGTGAESRTVQSKGRQVINLFDYMTDADEALVRGGTAVDVTTEFQAIVDHLDTVQGGTIVISPVGPYIMGAITVSSYHPINIISSMRANTSASVARGSYIIPASSLDSTKSIITYEAPDSGNRARNGAGIIDGLFFMDDGDLSNGTLESRRTQALASAIYLKDFDSGIVGRIGGTYLKGSLLKTYRSVLTSVSFIHAIYCGETGRPAVDLDTAAVGGSHITQSFTIDTVRLEACFNEDYLSIGAECEKVKIRTGGFEAHSSNAGTQEIFIDNAGAHTSVDGCHFNQNTALKVSSTGTYFGMTGANFSGRSTGGMMTVSGGQSECIGIKAAGANTEVGTAVTFSSENGHLEGEFKFCGNVIVSGAKSTAKVKVIDTSTTQASALLVSGSDSVVEATVDETPDDVIGVILSGTNSQLTNFNVKRIGQTTGSTATGVDIDTGSASVTNGFIGTVRGTGVDNLLPHNANNIIENVNGFKTKGDGTATIAAGTTSIAVTHGLADTPTSVNATPSKALNTASYWYISSVGATTFTINVNSAPSGTTDTFYWTAERVSSL